MTLEEARRRHWVLVGITTLAAIALCGGGLAYESYRSNALYGWVQDRLPPTIQSSGRLLEGMRLRAKLAGAQDKLGERLDVGTTLSDVEVRFLERRQDAYHVVSTPQRNAIAEDDYASLPLESVDRTLASTTGISPILWPDPKPKAIAVCSHAGAERVACVSLPLDAFITQAGGASALGMRYQLSLRDNPAASIGRSPNWADGDPHYKRVEAFVLGDIPMNLTGIAGKTLKESYGMADGRYFAIGSLAVYVGALLALWFRRRGVYRELALEDAVVRTRSAGDDLVRATLRNAANSAGVLIWLLHDDERIELIGPWNDLLGLKEGDSTLAVVLKDVADRETVRTSLLDALRRRAPWSRIIVQQVDGEPITLQANCAPLKDAYGKLVAMLGVSADISAALKTQSQASRDEAFRNAQSLYLRHMAKEVRGPSTHVDALLELLGRQIDLSDKPELREMMSLTADENRRLANVVQGSLDLMNLRGVAEQAKLSPMHIDAQVQQVCEQIALKDGAPRNQTLDFSGATTREVMVNHPSLVAMMGIALRNAFRYSPENASILVRLAPEDDALYIEIEDAGPGMNEAELARVGEPFFRGAAAAATEGSGLGLATFFELAEHTSSSARIQRSSSEGRGLLVTISLPWA